MSPSLELVAIKDVPTRFPWWPFSVWTTYNLIQRGKLRAVRVGRRRLLTEDHLREFIARNTR